MKCAIDLVRELLARIDTSSQLHAGLVTSLMYLVIDLRMNNAACCKNCHHSHTDESGCYCDIKMYCSRTVDESDCCIDFTGE